MLGREDKQGDFFDEHVYGQLVPEDDILLRIKREVDFSFVEEETRDLYSGSMGRPGFPPEVLFRMLFLEFWYNLSDVEVSKQCRYNLLYRVFVGLAIDDPTPDDTTLVVFRKRLGEERFGRVFRRIVQQIKHKGLLEEKLRIADATAVVADVAIPNTVNLLRQGRRVILRDIESENVAAARNLGERYGSGGKVQGKPNAEELQQEIAVTEKFLEEVTDGFSQEVEKKVEWLKGVLRPQVGKEKIASFVDPDARHGRKSPEHIFLGYKAHILEDTSEIVTSVEVLAGNRNEGHHLEELVEEERKQGIKGEALAADKLYDSARNREFAHSHGMKAYIPTKREKKLLAEFRYVKGEDVLECPKGHRSIGKSRGKRGHAYLFSKRNCRCCERRARCYSRTQKRARVWVSDTYHLNMLDHDANRPAAMKQRKMVERKFGEAKKWHGMRRARYRGKARVAIQVLMTFLVMNVKRMVRLVEAAKTSGGLPQTASA